MRRLAAVMAVLPRAAAPDHAGGPRFDWPLRPRPAVVRSFGAPTPDWSRGHRGVDLAGSAGQEVLAAGAGTGGYAGELTARPLVSIPHPGGLHTSYEPAQPSVRAEQLVAQGAAIGMSLPGHAG